MGFQDFGDFGHPRHPAIRTTGLLTFALAGLSPAEHTSVCWTQHPDVQISRFRFFTGELRSQQCTDERSGLPAEDVALGDH
jgi:hypothetical protein